MQLILLCFVIVLIGHLHLDCQQNLYCYPIVSTLLGPSVLFRLLLSYNQY